MKIEDLNKTQIVLLTLLVSFVTSIATGVVTVSLMDQAPQSVTQTINRIVERTVETVAPAAVAGSQQTVTKETTVVVKEDDLVTKSIQNASQSIVAVRTHYINSQGLAANDFLGWGIIISSEGTIATDSSFISESGTYTILTSDGISFPVKVLSQDEQKGVAILSVMREKDNDAQQKYNFSGAKIGDASKLSLGQSVIAFGGKSRKSVATGIVSDLILASASTSTLETKVVTSILASVVPPSQVTGGPLINNFGEVLGMSTGAGISTNSASYVPSIALKGAVTK